MSEQWMSYAEIAARRGISVPSAKHLVARNRWRRQKNNNGSMRILVPPEALSADTSTDTKADNLGPSADRSTDIARTFESALAALKEAHAAQLETLTAA